jgi:hypothetical protein
LTEQALVEYIFSTISLLPLAGCWLLQVEVEATSKQAASLRSTNPVLHVASVTFTVSSRIPTDGHKLDLQLEPFCLLTIYFYAKKILR